MPGDIVATHGPISIPTASDGIETYDRFILIRDGRMVDDLENPMKHCIFD